MEAITPEKQKANLWLASAIAGLAFHACLQFSDILDVLIWQMITGSVIAVATIFYIDIKVFQSCPLDAAKDLAVSTTAFTLSLATSILIYRAFFHRLRRFPGPFAARLTKLWSVYKSAKSMKYFLVLEDVHKKYGDVVRTGKQYSFATRYVLTQYKAPVSSPSPACLLCLKSPHAARQSSTSRATGSNQSWACSKPEISRTTADAGSRGKRVLA